MSTALMRAPMRSSILRRTAAHCPDRSSTVGCDAFGRCFARFNSWRPIFLLSLALIGFLAFGQSRSHAGPIAAGYDFFTTEFAEVELPGFGNIELTGFPFPDSQFLFPQPSIPEIQEVLFQITWFDMHGSEVGPDSRHKVGQIITPRPDLATFDTIIRRNASVTPTPTGEDVPIEIVWLSLMSVDPVDLPGFGLANVFVGLSSSAGQIPGRMMLTATTSTSGFADLGLTGVTTEDPNDPTFLGLPVVYDVLFIPFGQPAHPDNVVHRENNLLSIFHGDTASPSGIYQVVPEPSALVIWGSLTLMGVGVTHRRRRIARQSNSASTS